MRPAPTAPSEGTMALLSPCSVVQLLATVVAVLPLHLVPAARQEEACYFPGKWEGTWFQSGVRSPIIISQNRLSTKGRCTASEGDKFVVFDEKSCYRCVVIHEKHANVLQYKESYCRSRESLVNLCSLITGDALLYSMFRIEATAVPCPFKGPFTFTYNRGHGDCRSPVSSIDSCTEDSRLLLRYQACPDIPGTESTVEELQCLATWKEGSSRYLVGKVRHSHATSNEDRYRCFVYERSALAAAGGGGSGAGGDDGVDFRVAQSGDATCNGLFSPMEGSRTMTLRKAMSHSKCWFPAWLTSSLRWHTLDYARSYTFHHRNTTLRISNSSLAGGHKPAPSYANTLLSGAGISVSMGLSSDAASQEMRVVCTELKQQTGDVAHLVTHFTMGCQSGFMCMTFYRRDGHVIEVQTGSHTWRQEDACLPANFNKSTLPFVTLVTSSPEPRQCPYLGKFSVTGLSRAGRAARSLRHGRGRPRRDLDGLATDACPEESQDFTTLVVGCSTVDTMEFRSKCLPADVVSAYSCHGRWEDNGTHYLITTPLSRSSHGARRLCFMYRELEGLVLFSSSADSCQRGVSPGVGGALAFNVTSSGQCVEANSCVRPGARALWAVAAVATLAAWRHVER
ncbi:uncharacterized protein LOC134535094 [Bacillus rossius redtenbacheri]|uniref:uncharacterized protein LOC134535094 n=1 Tax=Bacillus rossius redtenbacheri TaxID=93214 RepID=UPI002FDE22C7